MTSTTNARRTEILNAAAELLIQKPASSLAEIAQYAGIGKATLHRYFASREDLMLALGYQALEVISKAIVDSEPERGSAIEALTRTAEALVPLGDKLHFLLSEPVLDNHPGFTAADRTTQEPVRKLIERGQSSGEIRTDLSTEWLLHILNYTLFATWQSVHDGSTARRDASRVLVTTLLGGIAAK